MERLRRTAAPIGAGPQAGGTGSPAQAVVGGPYTLPQRIFEYLYPGVLPDGCPQGLGGILVQVHISDPHIIF